MADKNDEVHFFGFCKFFLFGKKETASNSNVQETNDDDTYYSTPTRINVARHTFMNVTWANIFSLCKGKVKVCGWNKGGNISPKEDIFLPLENEVVNVSASWDKLLLITNKGRCHVMWNVYDDWGIHEVTSDDEIIKTVSFGCVGDSHCVAVDSNGVAYEIKKDESSEIINFFYDVISLTVQVDQVSCGKEHVLLLNKNYGTIYSFGLGTRGQLGLGQLNPEKTPTLIEALAGIKIQQIACGGWHSMALSEFGDLYAWGWNECGQLGITCVPPEVQLTFYMLPYIVEFPVNECVIMLVACGARHTVAVTSKHTVWTWGWGSYGQLGHGDTENRNTPTLVEYFRNKRSHVTGVTCGPWQTVVQTKLGEKFDEAKQKQYDNKM